MNEENKQKELHTIPEETAKTQINATLPNTPQNKGGMIAGVLIGLIAFIAILAFCWQQSATQQKIYNDIGVVYAKDNDLYLYDLKQDPQLVAEEISTESDGTYHAYYSAWGSIFNEDGSDLYYAVNVKDDGSFDLYHRDMQTQEPDTQITTGAFDYMLSAESDNMIYTKLENSKNSLYLFDGMTSTLIDDDIYTDTSTYAISDDGSYIMYCKLAEDGITMQLYVRESKADAQPILLESSAAIAMMSSETNKVYYAGAMETEANTTNSYAAYEYTFGEEPVKILDNVTYLEILPNGKDVLLMGKDTQQVLYRDIITDDMSESDALLTEDDAEYAAKQTRDEIRTAMENGDGIEPILQIAYIYHNGRLTQVAEHVISAVSVNHDNGYALCYIANETEKLPLSLVSSLEAAEYGYYYSLYYGTPNTVLVNATGGSFELEGSAIQATGLFLSDDGMMVGYYDTDMTTGVTTLHVSKLGGETIWTAENVDMASFITGTHDLAYYQNYSGGIGTLCIREENGTLTELDGVAGLHFAPDLDVLYYLNNMDETTGTGDLYVWQNGSSTQLDTQVSNTQYKYNGKMVYLKNYDFNTGIGDLYYYDGTSSKLLDEGVTAIYAF